MRKLTFLLFICISSHTLQGQNDSMNNEDILILHSLGVAPDIIIKKINETNPNYVLNNSTLLNFINEGIDYSIIESLILRTYKIIQPTVEVGAVKKKSKDKSLRPNSLRLGIGNDIGIIGLGLSINMAKNRKSPFTLDFNFGLRNLTLTGVREQTTPYVFGGSLQYYVPPTVNDSMILPDIRNNQSKFLASVGLTKYLGSDVFLSVNYGIRDWVYRIQHNLVNVGGNVFAVANYAGSRLIPVLGFSLSFGADIKLGKRVSLLPSVGYSNMNFKEDGGPFDVYFGGQSSAILGYKWIKPRQENAFLQLALAYKF
jgi:hypothetical protein